MIVRTPVYGLHAEALKDTNRVYVNYMNSDEYHQQSCNWQEVSSIRPYDDPRRKKMIADGNSSSPKHSAGFNLSLALVEESIARETFPKFVNDTSLLEDQSKFCFLMD